ncbi:MAG: DUF5996 family protein [Pseudonocardiaceae bacterium]
MPRAGGVRQRVLRQDQSGVSLLADPVTREAYSREVISSGSGSATTTSYSYTAPEPTGLAMSSCSWPLPDGWSGEAGTWPFCPTTTPGDKPTPRLRRRSDRSHSLIARGRRHVSGGRVLVLLGFLGGGSRATGCLRAVGEV